MKDIEYIDLRGKSPVDLVRQDPDKVAALIKSVCGIAGIASRLGSKAAFPISDKVSENWLIKTNNPYLNEIAQCADLLKMRGVYTLNLSYEWGCTTTVKNTANGPVMTRVLDWPFPNMDQDMIVAHQNGPAGDYYNVTWPGLTGTFNAIAPKRFSAAINQAPMKRHHLTFLGDWAKNRFKFNKETGLPPAHLLRKVMEEATDYAQAKQMLRDTPISLPVIYTLAGTKENEGCVIERLENSAQVHEMKNGSVCAANHWRSDIGKGSKWRPRRSCSFSRADAGDKITAADIDGKFSWFKDPIANKFSSLVMSATPSTGRFNLAGANGHKMTTKIFKR